MEDVVSLYRRRVAEGLRQVGPAREEGGSQQSFVDIELSITKAGRVVQSQS